MKICYAYHLGSCSDIISREHYISEALLKEFSDLEVSGFKWLNGETKKISTASLTSKILCSYHNSKLSSLDAEIVSIFRDFKELSDLNSVSYKNRKKNINAIVFEKWILKVLCGMVASGNASKDSGEKIEFEIPSPWVENLFSPQPLPSEIGIHIKVTINYKFEPVDRIGFSPITKPGTDQIIGCRLAFRGFPFYIFLEQINDINFLPKPIKIKIKKGKFYDTLHFFY
jgi:hypothetical protein